MNDEKRMETGTALKELRGMLNLFKPLKHLEEVLVEVLNAESDLATSRDHLKSVQKETEKANSELSNIKAELASFQKSAKERMETITADHLKKEEEMQGEFNENKETLDKSIEDLTNLRDEIEEDGETEITKLNYRIKDKEGVLGILKQDIKRLRESAARVEVE